MALDVSIDINASHQFCHIQLHALCLKVYQFLFVEVVVPNGSIDIQKQIVYLIKHILAQVEYGVRIEYIQIGSIGQLGILGNKFVRVVLLEEMVKALDIFGMRLDLERFIGWDNEEVVGLQFNVMVFDSIVYSPLNNNHQVEKTGHCARMNYS